MAEDREQMLWQQLLQLQLKLQLRSSSFGALVVSLLSWVHVGVIIVFMCTTLNHPSP